jgi:hypothetical protein
MQRIKFETLRVLLVLGSLGVLGLVLERCRRTSGS